MILTYDAEGTYQNENRTKFGFETRQKMALKRVRQLTGGAHMRANL